MCLSFDVLVRPPSASESQLTTLSIMEYVCLLLSMVRVQLLSHHHHLWFTIVHMHSEQFRKVIITPKLYSTSTASYPTSDWRAHDVNQSI